MPTFSSQDVVTLLRSSGLVRGEEAASLFAAGSPNLTADEIPSEHLLGIYSVRREILHESTGPYFTQLLDSVSEMCGRLEQYQGPCCFVEIQADYPYSLLALISSDGARALGCMRVRPTDEWLEAHAPESRA